MSTHWEGSLASFSQERQSGSSTPHPAQYRPRSSADRVHVAAVCYRVADGEIEFLLVRTQTGRWTFPKGGVDDDPTFAAAAAREAYEEAGVRGTVEQRAFALYKHRKAGAFRRKEVEVAAHLCRVTRLERAPEAHRDPTWFAFEHARKRLREKRARRYGEELERVLESALSRIQRLNRQ